MSDNQPRLHALDAAYKPFPMFEKWLSQTDVDTVRWERYKNALEGRAGLTDDVLRRARQIAKRAAALDTGAIEGLYDVDRGFTYTVAFETSSWEAALTSKGEKVRSLFEAQLHAYDYVLDLATKAEPISEAAIRALHDEVCRAQPTYSVITAIGPQEQPLPKGQYKTLPNHVHTRKGTDHSYAPVDVTPAEMARLVGELRSDAFLRAHPLIQASYAHYALVGIHPFADGNGRVARAFASTFTYRAISMPIVILSEQKDAYLDALERADGGDLQAFVDFMLARSLDTIKLVDESVRAALSPIVKESTAAIDSLYITRGGFTHEEIDSVGTKLLQAAQGEFKKRLADIETARVSKIANVSQMGYPISDAAYRMPLSGTGLGLQLALSSPSPAQAQVTRNYCLWLPRDAAREDDILLVAGNPSDTFAARMDEVLPNVSGPLQIRLTLFAERVLAHMFAELRILAEKSLGRP